MVTEVQNGEVAEACESVVAVDKTEATNDFNDRFAKSMAIVRYVRAEKQFTDASREFNEVCQEVRAKVGKSAKFVTQIEWKHYLVTSDDEGNFSVEPIDSI